MQHMPYLSIDPGASPVIGHPKNCLGPVLNSGMDSLTRASLSRFQIPHIQVITLSVSSPSNGTTPSFSCTKRRSRKRGRTLRMGSWSQSTRIHRNRCWTVKSVPGLPKAHTKNETLYHILQCKLNLKSHYLRNNH